MLAGHFLRAAGGRHGKMEVGLGRGRRGAAVPRAGVSALLAILLLASLACASLGPGTDTPSPIPPDSLSVSLLFPKPDTVVEMGQAVKFIVEVEGPGGKPIREARLDLSLRDPSGTLVAAIPAEAGDGEVYRSPAWEVPPRSQAGMWTVEAAAVASNGRGTSVHAFEVRASASEELLAKYGFWIDPPSFRGITPGLAAEKGDARDGMIRWGGVLPAQHVLPEEWLEIHWRQGNFGLEGALAARRFMLEEIGEFGFTQIRELGPFEEFRYKDWPAWKAQARGVVSLVQLEWVVFFAPETQQAFALGTTVVLPPDGVDAHALLRDSFELHPEIHASGAAGESLPRLLPAPSLFSPAVGAEFRGSDQAVALRWSSVKILAADEYYEIDVDYNYEEANPLLHLTSRTTEIQLPPDLYQSPNCHVFNWQVTLMKQTGTTSDGKPTGVPLSYRSFYWYFRWSYPEGEVEPFLPLCPNAQV